MGEVKEPLHDDSSRELAKSEQETVDMEFFGKYLTNEYEILGRTLSYLDINDLISASYVTNSWKQVCERLLQKRKDLRWHVRCKTGHIIPRHNFKNKINFKSVLGLGLEFTHTKNDILNELIVEDSYLCNSSVTDDLSKGSNIPGLQDGNMFIIKSSKLEIPYFNEKNELQFLDNAEAGILFPDLEGFEIHVEAYFFDEVRYLDRNLTLGEWLEFLKWCLAIFYFTTRITLFFLPHLRNNHQNNMSQNLEQDRADLLRILEDNDSDTDFRPILFTGLTDSDATMHECDELPTFSYPSIKGILVLSTDGDLGSFEDSFNDLLNRSTTPIALAGGIFDMVKKYSKKKKLWTREDDLVTVFFCGENVICHSDVLIQKDKNDVENFMKKMKTEVGPFDSKKQRRIAIISRCIARPNTKYEKSIFKQYFPDIPSFTLLAKGECGHHSSTYTTDESAIKKKKQENVSITNCFSVVYFFVTLQLPS